MSMQLSYFLAQLIGSVTALFALAALCQPRFVREVVGELEGSSLSRLLFSFIALVSGVAIVQSHSVWVADWPVLITLIGWGGIIKGFMAIALPRSLVSVGRFFYGSDQHTRIVLTCALIFGLCLAGVGFGYL